MVFAILGVRKRPKRRLCDTLLKKGGFSQEKRVVLGARNGPEADLKLAQDGSKFAKVAPRWFQMCTMVHFGVTLASLWITLGTLEGHFKVTLGVFGIILGDFGVSLKSL